MKNIKNEKNEKKTGEKNGRGPLTPIRNCGVTVQKIHTFANDKNKHEEHTHSPH